MGEMTFYKVLAGPIIVFSLHKCVPQNGNEKKYQKKIARFQLVRYNQACR